MKLLPKWIMQDTSPAVYDTESVTAIEGVAKLHAAMQAMINEYNTLVDSINGQFEQIVSTYGKDQQEYESALRQEFQDFIDIVNLKLKSIEVPVAATSASAPRIGEVVLLGSGWVGEASPFSQVVSIPGVTANSQVDLTPSVKQLSIFHEKDLAFVAENDDGVVTVYAIGQKPENDYTIQVTITEVTV